MAVTLRPVRPEDEPLLLELYESTRAEELALVDWPEEQKAAFVRHQFEAQRAHYAGHYASATHDVILVDGEPAGRLYVDRWPEEIRVVDIALLPEFRGHGVGGELLRRLQEEAASSGKSVSIHVERFNPARRLYERRGFELVDAGPVYQLMRWSSTASLPT